MQKGKAGKSPTKALGGKTKTAGVADGSEEVAAIHQEAGMQGIIADRNGAKMNFRGLGNASRSFVQKHMAREPLAPKFPDSARGESRQRASFLIDNSQVPEDRNRFTDLERMSQTPKVGERTFSKTPRATLSEASDTDNVVNEREKKTAGNADAEEGENDVQARKKYGIFSGILFSKHRNRR